MISYNHFTLIERMCLEDSLKNNESLRTIAKRLNRNVSSISREINRNKNKDNSYNNWRAQVLYIIRRKKCRKHFRIIKDEDLINFVKKCLDKYWSPEIIVAMWKKENQNNPLSPSTIYRAIKLCLIQGYDKKKFLRRRGKKKFNKKIKYNTIKPERSIHERSQEINERLRIGDWEGDTMCGSKYEQGFLVTLVDRKSRFLTAKISPNKYSKEINKAISKALENYTVHSITFDNGSEFVGYRELQSELETTVYFADVHSPWQRGTNENTNGILRFFFPRGTDFTKVSDDELAKVTDLINERPRKCLNWMSPKEYLEKCCT